MHVGVLVLCIILCAGGYLEQRDKYWRKVWEKLGKPDVHSIKELKQFIEKQKFQDS